MATIDIITPAVAPAVVAAAAAAAVAAEVAAAAAEAAAVVFVQKGGDLFLHQGLLLDQ